MTPVSTPTDAARLAPHASGARIRSSRRPTRFAAVLVGLFATGLATTMFATAWSSVAGRLLMFGAVLPAVPRLLSRRASPERRWFWSLFMFLAALVTSALVVAADGGLDAGSTADLAGHQAFLIASALLLTVLLRSRAARRVLDVSMTGLGLAAGSLVLVAYVRYGGGAFVPMEDLPRFKYFAANELNVLVNPLSFGSALGLALGTPFWWKRRALRWVILGIGSTVIFFSGARTTAVSFAAAIVLATLILLLLRQGRRLTIALLAVAFLGALAASTWLIDAAADLDGRDLSHVTTGRIDLWIAASRQFSERPWFGSGAFRGESIASLLPGYYEGTEETLIESAATGEYHNAYLALATKHGLASFIPGIVMLFGVVAAAFRAYRRRAEFHPSDRVFACVAPFLISVIVLRGIGEQAGFFGAANGLVDFLTYVGAARVVATLASSVRPTRAPADSARTSPR